MFLLVGMMLGCVMCSLEREMLVLTNKYRIDHNMEELYNLQSLQDAAEMQARHMCRRVRLTHDGPGKRALSLAGRLKMFGFVGLNIGENIAKQESDDYGEVVRLWMKSAEHRNNILGDYVYSGVATCVGGDGSRYWVQVFGKDVSNMRIAKMRDGIKNLNTMCRECERMKEDEVNGDGYIFVVKPGEDGKPRRLRRMFGEDQRGEEDRSGEDLLDDENLDGNEDGSALERRRGMREGRKMPESGIDGHREWKFVKRRSMLKTENDNGKRKGFGDYLLPSLPGNENRKIPNLLIRRPGNADEGEEPGLLGTAAMSRIPVLTLVLKNPNGSSVFPAIQSLVDIIKREDGGISNISKSSISISTTSNIMESSATTTSNAINSSSASESKSLPSLSIPSTVLRTTTVTLYREPQEMPSGRDKARKDTPGDVLTREDLNSAMKELLSPERLVNPTVRMNRRGKALLEELRRGRRRAGRTEREGDCLNGYDDEGKCVSGDGGGLGSVLGDMMKRGRLHLHISPDEECGENGCSIGSKEMVDIGSPLSHRF